MLERFTAPLELIEHADGSEPGARVRVMPYGEQIDHQGKRITFDEGSIAIDGGPVPVTLDHGDGALERIGIVQQATDVEGALVAELKISNTRAGRDTMELLRDGALTDVSAGIEIDDARQTVDDDGVIHRAGRLDHVAIVGRGAFSEAGAKVLAVHEKEAEMAEQETATIEAADTDQTDEVMLELAELRKTITELAVPDEPEPERIGFELTAEILEMAISEAGKRRENYAIADVVGDLGTNDASGLSPDWYWSEGLQQNIDRRRPLFTNMGRGPFPDYGNNLTSARVTQDVLVAAHSGQKAEAPSQALYVIGTTFPIVWHTGAVDVAYELIAQSSPSVLTVLRNSFLRQYAASVNGDATTKLQAAATHTGAALDTSTYAALVTDLITTSNLIEDATGVPGDICAVTPAQWIAILSLMDGGDRRQFALEGRQNSDGAASLTSRGIDVGGVFVFRNPDGLTALQYNEESAVGHERAPEFIQATNVPNVGLDMGIVGATVLSMWPAGAYTYEI